MVKNLRLTWGFSLCKLKIPAVLLENGKNGLRYVSSSGPSTTRLLTRRHRTPDRTQPYNLSTSPKKVDNPRVVWTANSTFPVRSALRTSEADIELAVVVSPPELVSQYSTTVGGHGASDTPTRIFVYLVSVALSLAALSILKLHKLLEWLLVDADVSNLDVSNIWNKSILIAEIVKAAALRFTKAQNTASSTPIKPCTVTSPLFPSIPKTESTKPPPKPVANATAFPAKPTTKNESTHKCGFCFHLAAAGGEPCLLCLLATGSLDNLTNTEQEPQDLRRRCQSECYRKNSHQSGKQKTNKNSYAWPTPSRLNAGVSRAQIGVCPHSLSHVSGLNLAAAVGKKDGVFHRFPNVPFSSSSSSSLSSAADSPPQRSGTEKSSESGSHPASPSIFYRSTKQVACVAPLSHCCSGLEKKEESKAPSQVLPITVPAQIFRDGSLYLTALQEENEEDFLECSRCHHLSALEQARQALSSLATITILSRASVSSSSPKIFQSRGVSASCSPLGHSHRDVANSPIDEHTITNGSSHDDVLSDSGDFELDVDGVWLTGDFYQTDANGNIFELDEDDDELAQIFDTSWVDRARENEKLDLTLYSHSQTSSSQGKYTPRSRSCDRNLEVTHDGQLSDLVALTTSISDDLMKLETGCQDLISRVRANCLELGKANDQLGFVWSTKDSSQRHSALPYDDGCDMNSLGWEEANDRSPPVSSFITSPTLIEEWFTSSAGEQVLARRETPLGRSFTSNSGDPQKNGIGCCSCDCHRHQNENRNESPYGGEYDRALVDHVAKWKASLIDRLPPSPITNFSTPSDLTFEDDDALQWCDAKPLQCRHSE